ncbi:MAG: hypothetical protein CVU95_12760 [Firmicutes bacterium HGW-Firmicutes-2]|nr:MAG: hypothetical protein CVU95_12760 [Firmicutes bacterium HGW-Firmicutes-2]
MKYIKGFLSWISIIQVLVSILFTVICFLLVPRIFGYKIAYFSDVDYDFEAINAVTGIISGVVLPILLVFLSAYIANIFEKKKQVIGDLNIATIEHVEKIKEDILKTIDQKPQVIDGGFFTAEEEIKNRKFKEKAYKFVCTSMIVNTHSVAEHLGVSDNEAFLILNELLRVDGTISCGGRASIDNIDNVVWMKKRN